MKDQLWPLIGVVLGWLLKEISSGLNRDIESKRYLGSLIAKLIRVRQQLDIYRSVTEGYQKDAGSWENYESFRQYVAGKHFLEPVESVSELNVAVADLEKIDPLTAIEVRGILDILTKSKSARLSESSKSPELYMTIISADEVALEQSSEVLRSLLLKLAGRHSLRTYVALFYRFYIKPFHNKRSKASAEKLMDEIQRLYREAQQ